jgi:serine protease Do
MKAGALAVLALLAGADAGGAANDISDWIKARADAYDAYLRAIHAAAPGQLWRERGTSEPIAPGFIGPTSLAPLIRAVSPSVVNISALNAFDLPGQGTPGTGTHRALGSGFIISPLGFVVTNNHVVDKAEQIRVKLSDGKEFLADVVGRDPQTDVALLKLEGDEADLPFAFLGDSDRLQVGDWVVAIGNPFGLDHSVCHGMISAKERVLGIGVFDDFIQTDAQINPGNSGGPLFNMHGGVVGVNTAIVTQGQGIGFAVPINMVKDLIPNLTVNGHLERGWLGITAEEITGDAEHRGAIVKDVVAGGPAAEAGVQPGDRIAAVNGRSVESYLEMFRRVSLLGPGSETKLALVREGVLREVTVRLGERPVPIAAPAVPGNAGPLGLVVGDVSAEMAQSLGLPPRPGALVTAVAPGSPAERGGLRAGDIIIEVDRVSVQDARGYRDALEHAGSVGRILVRYQRGEVRSYATLQPD